MTSIFRLGFTDAKPYDEKSFGQLLEAPEFSSLEVVYMNCPLNSSTLSQFTSKNFQGICCFVNDKLTPDVLENLYESGVRALFLRCAGFDSVHLPTCQRLGISVTRVPAYSPHAVAEFAMTLLMTLQRNVHKAYTRVRDGNFKLSGLVGTDMYGKTVGIIGTGKIGQCFANIALGYGCNVLAYDVFVCEELKQKPRVMYVELDQLLRDSDFISLHAPLLPSTHHLINEKSISLIKPSCFLVNTSRGGLIDTKALLDALLQGKLAGAALDVYEAEQGYFFNDVSDVNIQDEVLARLVNMRNVIITAHQAFLTQEALHAIASTTLNNWKQFFFEGKRGKELTNVVA